MLLIQLKKVLPSNTYTVLGQTRTYGNNLEECFEVFFSGPAKNIPERYESARIISIYPDRNQTQIVEIDWRIHL